jgi:1-acyl-sn-glycerol-3-phosphate acyltransferase
MKFLLRPLQWLYSLYAFILFVVLMFLVFPLALLASFFGRIRGGNMIMRLCMLWADIWFPLVFIYNKKIFEAPHDKARPYIFVSNHISYLDAAIIVKAFRQPIRPLGKIEMSGVPVFGFIYRNAIVTVDRGDAAHRNNSVRILKSILGKGISILVFPEGTFNMTTAPLKEFYDGAFRIALETRTPIKPVLFLDAYRRLGYHSIFSLSPGINRILYLDEIPVLAYTITDVARLNEKVFDLMKQKLIDYNGAWRRE